MPRKPTTNRTELGANSPKRADHSGGARGNPHLVGRKKRRDSSLLPATPSSGEIPHHNCQDDLVRAYDELRRQHAELIQLHAQLQDEIEQRREAEDSLCASLKAWQDTFDAAQDAICILSPDHRILLYNRTMEKYAEASAESLVGRQYYDVIRCTSSPKEGCVLTRVAKSRRRETMVVRHDDRWFVPLPNQSWMIPAR